MSIELGCYNTIGEWFDSIASAYSENIALSIPQYTKGKTNKSLGNLHTNDIQFKEYTYGYLRRASSNLANLLQEMGVKQGNIVAFISNDPLMITISILGIIKAGGAYLPIDPASPFKWKERMVLEGKCSVILTHEYLLGDSKYDTRIVCYETVGLENENTNYRVLGNKNDVLYLLYTSGTTGSPKGILVQHASMMNYVDWRIRSYGISANDITIQLLSESFDGFGANFYSSILLGGTLVYPDSMSRKDFHFVNQIIMTKKVTSMSLIPSMYEMMLQFAQNNELGSLCSVVLGGEKIPKKLVELNHKKYFGIRISNEYGLSETTITASACLNICAEDINNIGEPISNTYMYVLDQEMNPVPDGMTGELYISGICLAKGYMSNENSHEFIHNHFDEYLLLFRTGDFVKRHKNGTYTYVGRKDSQVKMTGCRFRLGDVENAFLETQLIKKVSVSLTTDEAGISTLNAYTVPEEGVNTGSLKVALSELIPQYMIPSNIIFMSDIPCTISGKINKTHLDAMHKNEQDDEIINEIKHIWENVLQNDVRIDIPFFDAGGNSLLLINVYMQINLIYPNCISIAELFDLATIKNIAEHLKKRI